MHITRHRWHDAARRADGTDVADVKELAAPAEAPTGEGRRGR